jgi:hypothetical protein
MATVTIANVKQSNGVVHLIDHACFRSSNTRNLMRAVRRLYAQPSQFFIEAMLASLNA